MSWPAPVSTAVVRITTSSGAVRVRAEADRTECWSNVAALDVSPITVDGKSSAVEVRVPEGTDLVIGTTSGRVTVEGRVGAVSVLTTSGRISIDRALSVDARTRSGRVHVGHAEGVCRIVSTSGTLSKSIDAGPPTPPAGAGGSYSPMRTETCERRPPAAGSAWRWPALTTSRPRPSRDASRSRTPTTCGRSSSRPTPTLAAATQEHDCTVVARSGSGRVVVADR